MISNERRWPSYRSTFQRQPYYERPQAAYAPRPQLREDTLASRELQIERKHFLMILKENQRGRFVRIAESANGRSNSIIIPIAGLADFKKMLDEMVAACAELPARDFSQPPESMPAAEVDGNVRDLV
jgi:hypothetical protein